MSGGVRNLRAMFEQHNDTTNSERGLMGDVAGGDSVSTSTTPKPLPRVRTSFVTVGRCGRDPSGEHTINGKADFSLKEGQAQETRARKENQTTTGEVWIKSTISVPESSINTGAMGAEKEVKTVPSKTQARKPAGASTSNGNPNGSAKLASKASSKPPITTSQTTSSQTPSFSSTLKAPTTLSQPQMHNSQVVDMKTGPGQNTRSAGKTITTSVPGVAAKTKNSSPLPPQTGSNKLRPRSPTRPVKLPASLTAPTASSDLKKASTGPPPTKRSSLGRASGNVTAPTTRSSSVISTTSKTGLTGATSFTKSGADRPSLGPPPVKKVLRHSLPSSAAPADDSFLARMMRPTTASASKTALKQPTTPPKLAKSVTQSTTHASPNFEALKSNKASKPTTTYVGPLRSTDKAEKSVKNTTKKPVTNQPTVTHPKVVSPIKEADAKSVPEPVDVHKEIPEISKPPVTTVTSHIAQAAEAHEVDLPKTDPIEKKSEVANQVATDVDKVKEEGDIFSQKPDVDTTIDKHDEDIVDPALEKDVTCNVKPSVIDKFEETNSIVIEDTKVDETRNEAVNATPLPSAAQEETETVKVERAVLESNNKETIDEPVTVAPPDLPAEIEELHIEIKNEEVEDQAKKEEPEDEAKDLSTTVETSSPISSSATTKSPSKSVNSFLQEFLSSKPSTPLNTELAMDLTSPTSPKAESVAELLTSLSCVDPEDLKAAEEIARLNAGIFQGSEEI